jgi:cytochrome c-type biogenesis protein CcmH/NrfG
VRLHPHEPSAFDSLGDGYTAAGRLEDALASYRKAVQLGESSNDARLPSFRENVERAEQLLREASSSPQH